MATNLTAQELQGYIRLLDAKNSNQEATRYLAEALKLPEYTHDARSSVQLDYAAWMCTLCHKLQLDLNQTAAVIQIGQQLLEGCTVGVPRSQAQDLLRSALLQLCIPARTPPAAAADTTSAPAAGADAAQTAPTAEAAACGSPVQLPADVVTALAASFTSTLLQHYNLWSFVFTQEQQHVQHQHHLMVETPVAPPPLQASLIESDWQAHLAAEQAQREAQAAAAEAAERAAREAQEAAEAAAAEAAEAAARAEQLQRKPKTLDEAVDKLVALKLEDVRTGLTADYAAKAAALAAHIEHLQQQQQQQAAQAAAAVSSANNSSHGGRASASSRLGSAGSRVASAKPTAS